MAKSARKHNAPWTPADLKKMRALAKSKLSARLAAKELGRSTGAVKYKAMVEGIRFRFIDQPAGVQLKLARKAKRAKKEVVRRPTQAPRTGVRGGFAQAADEFRQRFFEQTARRRHHDFHRDVAPRHRAGRGQRGSGLS